MYESELPHTGAGLALFGTTLTLNWVLAAAIGLMVVGMLAVRYSGKAR